MKVKEYMLLFVVLLMTLSSLATINVPVKAQEPYVKVYVDQPLGYISGVPEGDTFTVDIIIEVNNITDDSPEGIVGWGLFVQVDPDVLNITRAMGATSGYFLWEFSDWYFYNYPIQLSYRNATTGLADVTEQIVPTPPGGAGDGTSYPTNSNLLLTLEFRSKSETAYSKIDITTILYMTTNQTWLPPDEVIDGQYNALLTVGSTPNDGIDFTVNTTTYTTNSSIGLIPGNYTVTMPSTLKVKSKRYNFLAWESNSTNPVRNISLASNMAIIATYQLEGTEYLLTVSSGPITGIDFTVDGITNTTNWSGFLLDGSYTVSMPSTWTVGTDQYNFVKWEDSSTNPVRVVPLASNTTITATYAPVHVLTVGSTPTDGIDFTVNTTTYTTNSSIGLIPGNYTVTMPSSWIVGADKYNFVAWEDNSTNPVRVVSLIFNTTITATYELTLAPVASFTFSPAEPLVDETVTFNASASYDPDGTISNYSWDFGDGGSGSDAIMEHVYTAAGNYNVTLTVTDNDELTHTITKAITVKETPPPGIPLELYLIAAGVIGVIIIAIVVYYVKFMKQKPA